MNMALLCRKGVSMGREQYELRRLLLRVRHFVISALLLGAGLFWAFSGRELPREEEMGLSREEHFESEKGKEGTDRERMLLGGRRGEASEPFDRKAAEYHSSKEKAERKTEGEGGSFEEIKSEENPDGKREDPLPRGEADAEKETARPSAESAEPRGESAKEKEREDSRVNINTASLEELDTLPGIGKVTAGLIIAYREKNGGFADPEELKNVKRIGDKTYEKLKDRIRIR